jgi:vitamin B12 transporter
MIPSFLRAQPLRLAAASLVFTGAAHGQAPQFELTPVTVTGTGTPRTLGSEIAATSVLTRADIERAGARDAVQVLQMLGTALVEQQGGAGTLAAVRVRGADARDTLVLVDGLPLNDVTTGQPLFQQIPADLIERVEVVRGNLSALYGANATGGVIQIFTRRGPASGATAQVEGGLGSRGTRAWSASAGVNAGLVRARWGAGFERTEGFSAGNTANANPDADGNHRKHAWLALDAQLAQGHEFAVDLRHVDGRAEYDDPQFGLSTDTHQQRELQTAVAVRASHALGGDAVKLAWRLGDSRQSRRDTVVSQFGGVRDNTLHNKTGAVELSVSTPTGLVALAAVERLVQSTTSASYTQRGRDTDVVRAGVIYDGAWFSMQANLRHDRTSDFGSATTGLLGARFAVGGGWSAVTSASTSFTPPTLDFLFFDCSPFTCSNPDLQPEKARNVDAGVQWENSSTLLRATAFTARYKDKIVNDANFVPRNMGRAKNDGLELTARQAMGTWAWRGEATFQNPRDAGNGARLIRRARRQLALRADYTQPAWHAGGGLRHVGDRLDTGGRARPSYTVVDASAHWTFAPQWSLSASVDNVFDRHYEPVADYNGRPRSLFLGLSWKPQP